MKLYKPGGLLLLVFWCQIAYTQSHLMGKIRTDGEIMIGASVYIQSTDNGAVSDINGMFNIKRPAGEAFYLVLHPCCTCISSTVIKVLEDTSIIEIDCRCHRNKAIVLQKNAAGEISKTRHKIGR